ncbi:uncharacterized protein MYCFIDRAFT_212944 [Pseudocercospora fijiensis CIRAD86]|uniref:SH3 domain-containing protein n=1 Tax=Pseudocercospora fijiensis (strain CIRAD86) TaxID=383855 RepID=N1Q629_PSEFD|nr:uncharacterized protein MYCFIDRAFT_212944 [Pseudocercospora fijiensis CIRAD86]EME87594.1 hypothetical protein MYCFIDRAFT_212944 [Pseudocercospora fijiensis CIRAD86]
MPWKPLPSVAFGIVSSPFTATAEADLPLQIGDHVYIIEQGGRTNEWYRGYLVAPPSLLAGLTSERGQQLEHRVFSGIFPANCVQVREYLGDGHELPPEAPDEDEDEEEEEEEASDERERRRSEVMHARRASRRLSRRKSSRSGRKRKSKLLMPDEPVPRLPDAPKPLAPVPLLRVGDETGQSAQEPLVDEIASCLREWHDARLHEMLLARGYSQLATMEGLIKRVDNARSLIMHDVLTRKELADVREDTVWDLVAGNKMLCDEVIVRSASAKGRILTADDSVIEMTKLQANMSILERPPKVNADKHMLYHVLAEVRNLVVDHANDQPGTLHMCLFTKQGGEKARPISENYAISVPVPVAPSTAAEDQPRTLFVNLSGQDVGVGAEQRSLYLVFKLLRDEPVRQSIYGQGINHASHAHAHAHAHKHKPSMSMLSRGDSQPNPLNSSAKGRRSVFGSQRRSKSDHGRSDSTASARPETGHSDRSGRQGSAHGPPERPASASRDMKMVRRCVGVGAVDITTLALAQSRSPFETAVTLWTPSDRNDQGSDWAHIIQELSRSVTGGYVRSRTVKRCDVFVQAFASADLERLIRNTPTMLHNILMTPKLGFSGVPSEKRSDIYLTLTDPRMPRNATLAHAKFGAVPLNQRCQTSLANLQLTLEARRANGERIDGCIFTAANHHGHTAWRTTGIERGEAWNQTIRLAIPAEELPGSHVVMSIADSPNFPFALSWIPLWENEAFVRDGDHHVALYVYDEYSSSIIGGKGAYLALPPWHNKQDPVQQNAAVVTVSTFLCSTEYSQDPSLLGVLHWRNYHGSELIELLERFPFVPEIEIVKLLRDVFSALFEILHEYEGQEKYEDIIFYNFVVILRIARDKRFELGDIIKQYATTRHTWPDASKCLIGAYQRLVGKSMDPDSSRKLRDTFKVGDQILKLVMEVMRQDPSVQREIELNGMPRPEQIADVRAELKRLFVSIMSLLRNPMPILLGTQTLLIQRFSSWLPELTLVMSPMEVLEIATDLLDSCSHARGKMILYRLIVIINYSHLDIFKVPDARTSLVAKTFHWLEPYWGFVPEPDQQWRDQVRLCCSVVAAQMEQLQEDSCQYVPKLAESFSVLKELSRPTKRVFSMLFPTSYPFPTKNTTVDIDVDEAMLEISALLAAALTSEQRLYFDASLVDVTGTLLEALKVGQSILSCEAFPRSWLSLLVSHHKYGMTALERIEEVLVESLPDVYAPDAHEAFDFDTNIWRAYFNTLFAALGSPALAMETFPEQKRRAVWKIAGDVRELGADLLKRSWEAIGWETDVETKRLHGFDRMGGYQVQFVPDLIAPIVELCLSVHASLRAVSIEVLRSMIVSAWQIDQDLSIIQTAMIDCLDKLCRNRSVTETVLQKTFVPEMLEQFKGLHSTAEDSLYNAVHEMFGKIDNLLVMLASVHTGNMAANDSTRLVDTLHLMEFLRDVDSEDAYIRYVHQLADMQTTSGNAAEAGLALQMHADRYEWDPNHMLPEMTDPKMPAQSAFERKEQLYFQICQNFEKGQAWKRALTAYRELAVEYELNTFDFGKLARTQRAIAGIHERIARGERTHPRYFRVVYLGLGFPATLRDKHFIFEGLPTDRLAMFEDRMQQLHPSATILRGGLEADVEGQFLQIYAVSPNKDIEHMLYQRTKVSQAVREYNLISNPQRFATTSRHPAHDIPITEQIVEKVIYTTAEEFPTILRRSEVVKIETVTLLPIEAAIERTTRKTQELLAMEKRIASGDDETDIGRLTDDLMSSVDPDSDSSVSRYRGLLPSISDLADNASSEITPSIYTREDQPLDNMQNALKVALLDHTLAIRRCLALYRRPALQATRAELVPRFEATFQAELTLLFPTKPNIEDITPRASIEEVIQAAPAKEDTTATTAGAPQNDENGIADEKRQGRRRSIPFLRRASSRQGRGTENGVNGDSSGPAESRNASRTRERSSSRLSFFRRDSEQNHSERRDRSGSDATALGSSTALGSLRKRLSFLNGSSPKVDEKPGDVWDGDQKIG